jgi:Hemerythrin HHE cation binding domain
MTQHQDAISLLTDDHRTVEQLFADSERGLQGPQARRQVVDQVIRELSVHAAIEEACFYPEVRKALGEGGELVDESLHEHQEVKEALAAPGAKVAGPAAGMVDRVRDRLGDRPADADAQPWARGRGGRAAGAPPAVVTRPGRSPAPRRPGRSR